MRLTILLAISVLAVIVLLGCTGSGNKEGTRQLDQTISPNLAETAENIDVSDIQAPDIGSIENESFGDVI